MPKHFPKWIKRDHPMTYQTTGPTNQTLPNRIEYTHPNWRHQPIYLSPSHLLWWNRTFSKNCIFTCQTVSQKVSSILQWTIRAKAYRLNNVSGPGMCYRRCTHCTGVRSSWLMMALACRRGQQHHPSTSQTPTPTAQFCLSPWWSASLVEVCPWTT